MIPPPFNPPPAAPVPLVTDRESAFYMHVEVADTPGVLAQVAEILGMQGASIRSVVQKGLGDDARWRWSCTRSWSRSSAPPSK